MTKRRKIIFLVILAIFIALLAWLVFYELFKTCGDCGKPPINKTPTAKQARLEDPNLLYASLTSFDLCGNSQGQQGGCYTELYLYKDGKFEKLSGFITSDNPRQRDEKPAVEKQLGQNFANIVALEIKNSGLITKDCPPQMIMDAGWDYKINLAGETTDYHNPPKICKDKFDKIDKLIKTKVGIKQ